MRRSAAVWQVQEYQLTRLARHWCSDGALGLLADDQITLPVAGHGAVVRLGGALADNRHVLDASLRAGSDRRPAAGAPAAQACAELLAQRPAAVQEERPVDRLVTDAHVPIIRVRPLQVSADLLRRPQVGRQPLDCAAQASVTRQLRRAGPGCEVNGAVLVAPIVSVPLAGDGRQRAFEPHR